MVFLCTILISTVDFLYSLNSSQRSLPLVKDRDVNRDVILKTYCFGIHCLTVILWLSFYHQLEFLLTGTKFIFLYSDTIHNTQQEPIKVF